MSYNDLFLSLNKRANAHGPKFPNTRWAARGILWVSLVIAFFALAAPVAAPAAELGAMTVHAKAHKHFKKAAYYGCRTGWWQAYCDGMRRPRWATRCSY